VVPEQAEIRKLRSASWRPSDAHAIARLAVGRLTRCPRDGIQISWDKVEAMEDPTKRAEYEPAADKQTIKVSVKPPALPEVAHTCLGLRGRAAQSRAALRADLPPSPFPFKLWESLRQSRRVSN
jgi:hypothetical protein